MVWTLYLKSFMNDLALEKWIDGDCVVLSLFSCIEWQQCHDIHREAFLRRFDGSLICQRVRIEDSQVIDTTIDLKFITCYNLLFRETEEEFVRRIVPNGKWKLCNCNITRYYYYGVSGRRLLFPSQESTG